ncbi:MAG: flagellar basal body P-ring protein FlgI [Planctomycetota bacterium]|nr:flagellar basal body P-ring protein FlgI [Planctomycetota bacterium]
MKILNRHLILFFLATSFSLVHAERIKDVARIQGMRSNPLKGLGIVVGLTGTGDGDSILSRKPFVNLLNRMNFELGVADVSTKNIAVVMVTATLPAFSRPGQSILVNVSSIGDATNLKGGRLLPTPLQGPGYQDPTVYALANGPLTMGTNPTTASIPSGGIVETSPPGSLIDSNKLRVLLERPDFTTASQIALQINQDPNLFPGASIAHAVDAMTIEIDLTRLPKEETTGDRLIHFVSRVEQVEVTVDTDARIVINENTQTVIINGFVRVSPALISHKNLQLVIPGAGANGEQVMPFGGMDPTSPLQQILDGLNAMGVGSQDVIDIVKALHEAGAVRAKLVVLQ